MVIGISLFPSAVEGQYFYVRLSILIGLSQAGSISDLKTFDFNDKEPFPICMFTCTITLNALVDESMFRFHN